MKVSSVAQMRELDRRATDEFGIPSEILMENAGEAAYSVIRSEFGVEGKRFVVCCGAGNNGGDGFVVARRLHSSGGQVRVFILGRRDRYQGAARSNLDTLSRFPIGIEELASACDMGDALVQTEAVVDAIFGTGLERPVEGLHREVVQLINRSTRPVFALDIPSGINGDTGLEMGVSVKADFTVAFGLPKVGNLLYPGYGRGGKLYVSHISFPPSLYESDSLKVELAHPVALPEKDPDASKMDYGPVLVIAGAASYYWAPYASAYSVLKAGGGYVHLACPRSLAPFVAQEGREIVFQPQDETASGSLALSNRDGLLELSRRMRMVVLGPGLSLDEETQELARRLAREIDRPLLVDGDGLTAVAGDEAVLKGRKAPTILTPHTGEMARLAGLQKEDIEKDRVTVLQETAARLNATIVLKGPRSLVGYPDGRVFVNVTGATRGQAGMATAGTGDVLNGTIAAMFCLGLEVQAAVRAGVFVHGLAGDLAAVEKGPDGMTARDVLEALPHAIRRYRDDLAGLARDYYGTVHVI